MRRLVINAEQKDRLRAERIGWLVFELEQRYSDQTYPSGLRRPSDNEYAAAGASNALPAQYGFSEIEINTPYYLIYTSYISSDTLA